MRCVGERAPSTPWVMSNGRASFGRPTAGRVRSFGRSRCRGQGVVFCRDPTFEHRSLKNRRPPRSTEELNPAANIGQGLRQNEGLSIRMIKPSGRTADSARVLAADRNLHEPLRGDGTVDPLVFHGPSLAPSCKHTKLQRLSEPGSIPRSFSTSTQVIRAIESRALQNLPERLGRHVWSRAGRSGAGSTRMAFGPDFSAKRTS